ncbi:MAG: response regulator transcription factor [Acidobacteriota bacterium]|nr:response regulator transcription factor [Acidobacteriota bacterium]
MASGKRVQQILVADDHLLFRRGLRTVLAPESDLELLAEVFTLDQALAKAQEHLPDVLLMDVALLETASEPDLVALRHMQASLPVLFMASADEPRYLELAMSAGARGYMLKNSTPVQLLAGIRRVAQSNAQEPQILSNTAADLRALAGSSQQYARGTALTSREQEILRLLAEGRTVRETAEELGLSAKTVEAHKLNLMRKLDIHNRATLIEYAIEKGFIQPAVAA